MTEINEDTLNSLAGKLEALELGAGEQAVLDGLLERAAAYEPEVEGFGFSDVSYSSLRSGSGLTGLSLNLGISSGLVVKPTLGYRTDNLRGGGPPPP